MHERRKIARTRTLLHGEVIFNTQQSTIECTVRNLSRDGARLAFPSTAGVPQRFALTIRGKMEGRMATVAWRTPTVIGVVIEPVAERTVMSIEMLRRIRVAEAARQALGDALPLGATA